MSWQQVFVIDKVRLWHLDLMQFSPVSVPPPASSPYSKLAPLVEPYLNFEIHTRLECFYTVHYTFLCTPLRFGKSCWCFEARSRPQIVELSSLNPEFDKVRWASETAIFISWSSIKTGNGRVNCQIITDLISNVSIDNVILAYYRYICNFITRETKKFFIILQNMFLRNQTQLLSFKPATAPRDLPFVWSDAQ